MFRYRRVAVVVPCYNVARHIADVVRTLPDLVDDVILVDDGSRDDLAAAVDPVMSDRVVLLRHERNRGLAGAMETGFRKALELGADVVVKIDGDGQMDPRHIPQLLVPIVAGQADLAKGNRLLRARHRAGMPQVRLIGNLALSFLTKIASGYWNIFDPANGYIAIRRQVLEQIELARLGPGHFFEISLLCQAQLVGAVVTDVSMPARYGSESSSLSPRRASMTFPTLLLQACLRRIAIQHFVRDFTPVALLLLSGAALTGFGLIGSVAIWIRNSQAHHATPAGTIALFGLPLLLGSNLLLQALVLDIGSVPTRSPWAAQRGRARAPRGPRPAATPLNRHRA